MNFFVYFLNLGVKHQARCDVSRELFVDGFIKGEEVSLALLVCWVFSSRKCVGFFPLRDLSVSTVDFFLLIWYWVHDRGPVNTYWVNDVGATALTQQSDVAAWFRGVEVLCCWSVVVSRTSKLDCPQPSPSSLSQRSFWPTTTSWKWLPRGSGRWTSSGQPELTTVQKCSGLGLCNIWAS